MPTNEDKPNKPSGLPGLTAAACFIAGALGIFCALVSITSSAHGDISEATGLCLIASALSFGLLANATFRK